MPTSTVEVLVIGAELLSTPAPMHLIAGYGPERVLIEAPDLLEVDMRRLVARLQGEVRAAGCSCSVT
jgi:hypothetical protein